MSDHRVHIIENYRKGEVGRDGLYHSWCVIGQGGKKYQVKTEDQAKLEYFVKSGVEVVYFVSSLKRWDKSIWASIVISEQDYNEWVGRIRQNGVC